MGSQTLEQQFGSNVCGKQVTFVQFVWEVSATKLCRLLVTTYSGSDAEMCCSFAALSNCLLRFPAGCSCLISWQAMNFCETKSLSTWSTAVKCFAIAARTILENSEQFSLLVLFRFFIHLEYNRCRELVFTAELYLGTESRRLRSRLVDNAAWMHPTHDKWCDSPHYHLCMWISPVILLVWSHCNMWCHSL